MFVKLPGNRVVLLVKCAFIVFFPFKRNKNIERADTWEILGKTPPFVFTLDSMFFFFFVELNLAGLHQKRVD